MLRLIRLKKNSTKRRPFNFFFFFILAKNKNKTVKDQTKSYKERNQLNFLFFNGKIINHDRPQSRKSMQKGSSSRIYWLSVFSPHSPIHLSICLSYDKFPF